MKETKRKQKHPNWVVRVPQGGRDTTATQQTTQGCPKRQKNTKMRKAEKNTTGGKRRQTCIYIHTYKHTAHSKTRKMSTQHILNFHIHSFASWIPGCSTCKGRSRNARTTEKRQDKKKRSEQSRHATHNTPVNRTCPRVLTLRVASCCVGWCCAAAPAHTHTHTRRRNQRIKP